MIDPATSRRLFSFDFEPGRIIAGKYDVIGMLGRGWEGEVYRVQERSSGVERAAKFFFPHRNAGNRVTKFYARKLHKLRHCPILIQYHTQERIVFRRVPVTVLVSEYVEGELLSRFLERQPGRHLTPFEGLHLLHVLASGLEKIHQVHEYHGDLHDDNVIIRRRGLSFYVKLVDMFNWGPPSAENIREDVFDLIRLFYDSIGGRRLYARQPRAVKGVCCGLKRTLISQKFKTAGHLRRYLETMKWEQ